jgi:hypothetical protein
LELEWAQNKKCCFTFVLPLSIKVGAKYSLYDIPVLPVHTIYNVVDVKSKIKNIFLFDGSIKRIIYICIDKTDNSHTIHYNGITL